MATRTARIAVSDERLLTREGTIIPMSVRFADGGMLLVYSVGFDGWFEPNGMSRSEDGGATWQKVEPPLYRMGACGQIGPAQAIFLDDALVHVGGDEYRVLYSRTNDGGRTFTEVGQAQVHIANLIPKVYEPDPSSPHFPPVPEWYRKYLPAKPAFGGNLFGRVIRLSDGALATVGYGAEHGNLQKRRKQGQPASAGVAEQGTAGESNSAILLRSEDEGQTWHAVSRCGKLLPNLPFDGGYFFSEGFNETGLVEVSPHELFVVMRHGSYHLLWSNRSVDGGKTWQGIKTLNHAGVAPHMVKMGSGILAAAWGRPGLTVAFSLDGSGRRWDVTTELMRDDEASQRYPWIQPLDDHNVLILYDRRKWDRPHPRYVDHGIFARQITVTSA